MRSRHVEGDSAKRCRAASTTAYAAVTPMAGAPRTTIARIASATSAHSVYRRLTDALGSTR